VKIDNLTKPQRKELARDDLERKSSDTLNPDDQSDQMTDLARLTEEYVLYVYRVLSIYSQSTG